MKYLFLLTIFIGLVQVSFSQKEIELLRNGSAKDFEEYLVGNSFFKISGSSALLIAAEYNDDENAILFLFEKYSQLDSLSFKVLESLVSTAIIKNKNELLVKVLSHPNFDINKCSENLDYPIFYSLYAKNSILLMRLIEYGADINVRSNRVTKYTPLQYSVATNRYDLLEILLKNGADINKPLAGNEKSIIEFSLEKRANYNSNYMMSLERCDTLYDNRIIDLLMGNYHIPLTTKEKQLLLIYSISSSNINLFNRVVKACTKTDVINAEINETFDIFREAISNTDDNYLKKIIKLGFDVNCKFRNNITPLMLAFRFADDLKIIKILITNGADCNQIDNNKQNMLHYAACNKNAEFANFLINKEFDINSLDDLLTPPLFYAIDNMNIEVVKLFLENNADFNYSHHKTETALYFACKSNNLEMVKLVAKNDTIVNSCGEYESVFHAIIRNCVNDTIISWLIENLNADVNIKNKAGNNAIFAAVWDSPANVLKVILPYIDNINCIDRFGNNALLSCLGSNDYKYEKIELLVNAGINVNIMNEYGYNPLIKSIERGKNLKTIKLLLKFGADKDVLHGKDNIPAIYYMFSKSWRHDELQIFSELIKLGLRVDFPPVNGCDNKCYINNAMLLLEDDKKILVDIVTKVSR